MISKVAAGSDKWLRTMRLMPEQYSGFELTCLKLLMEMVGGSHKISQLQYLLSKHNVARQLLDTRDGTDFQS